MQETLIKLNIGPKILDYLKACKQDHIPENELKFFLEHLRGVFELARDAYKHKIIDKQTLMPILKDIREIRMLRMPQLRLLLEQEQKGKAQQPAKPIHVRASNLGIRKSDRDKMMLPQQKQPGQAELKEQAAVAAPKKVKVNLTEHEEIEELLNRLRQADLKEKGLPSDEQLMKEFETSKATFLRIAESPRSSYEERNSAFSELLQKYRTIVDRKFLNADYNPRRDEMQNEFFTNRELLKIRIHDLQLVHAVYYQAYRRYR